MGNMAVESPGTGEDNPYREDQIMAGETKIGGHDSWFMIYSFTRTQNNSSLVDVKKRIRISNFYIYFNEQFGGMPNQAQGGNTHAQVAYTSAARRNWTLIRDLQIIHLI